MKTASTIRPVGDTMNMSPRRIPGWAQLAVRGSGAPLQPPPSRHRADETRMQRPIGAFIDDPEVTDGPDATGAL